MRKRLIIGARDFLFIIYKIVIRIDLQINSSSKNMSTFSYFFNIHELPLVNVLNEGR